MDYAKTALRLHDAGQEEEARKVLAEGVMYYSRKAEDLFNGTPYCDIPILVMAAERICGFLRNTDGFINGQANVFDESLGEYVSKSIIVMTIARGEEEQCLE